MITSKASFLKGISPTFICAINSLIRKLVSIAIEYLRKEKMISLNMELDGENVFSDSKINSNKSFINKAF